MEGLAAVVVENEHGRLSAVIERERLSGPAGIEQRGQSVFVLEPCNALRDRTGGDQREHRDGMAGSPGSIQGEVAVIVQRLQLISGEIHGGLHCRPKLVVWRSTGAGRRPELAL
jgi:hypothetical protein